MSCQFYSYTINSIYYLQYKNKESWSIIVIFKENTTIIEVILYYARSDKMAFLRWLGGFIVLFWLIGLIFKIGGGLINILLLVAAIIFVIDAIFGRKKTM